MDSFIKIVEQKKEEPVTTLHVQQIETLQKYIKERKNVFICGGHGVGKTYVLQKVLNESNSIEIQKEHIKNKSPFLSFIKGAAKHAYIEDYDIDYKPLIEMVCDGGRLTRGSLIVTSTTMCFLPNFETIFIPKHKPEKLLTLVENNSHEAEQAAIRCNGNIHDFFSYLEGYHQKDTFKTPKEYIYDILSNSDPIGIPSSIHEHGHIWDIFQENYLDSKNIDMVKVSDGFSIADIYDCEMYSSGDWHLMPYFVLNAIVIPKAYIGKPIIKDKIRPGSCWTKYGNYKMRKHKYNELNTKTGLCIEELCLLKKYAENGDIKPMIEYNLTAQDFDVMNHLAVGSKLKQKDVTRIKKVLKNANSSV